MKTALLLELTAFAILVSGGEMAAQNCVQPAAGLVSWWPGEGNATDIWGNNPGTLQNGVMFTSGLVGQAFSFNGVNNYAFVNSTMDTEKSYSLDFWMNPLSIRASPPVIVMRSRSQFDVNDFGFMIHMSELFGAGSDQIQIAVMAPNSSGQGIWVPLTGPALSANTWTHIAFTYSPAGQRKICLYVNGNLADTKNITQELGSAGYTFAPTVTTDLLVFGADYWGYGEFAPANQAFPGQLDEISTYNQVLTQQQIQAIYNAGSAGKCESSLVFGFDSSSKENPSAFNWSLIKSFSIKYNNQNYPLSFVILRATKGNANLDNYCAFTDPDFTSRAAAANLIVGAYHVASITNMTTSVYNSPVSEADFFVGWAGSWISPGNMRPVLDVEDDQPGSGCDTTRSTFVGLSNWVDQWMQEVERLKPGVVPIIYCNETFAGVLRGLASKYPLWIAEPGTDPNDDETIAPWSVDLIQYNWHGSVSGISGDVNLDAFQGRIQDFMKILVIPPIQFAGLGGGALQPPQNGSFQFQIFAPGQQYITVQKSFNLANWTDLVTQPTSSAGTAIITDANASGSASFYRVKQ
jgi:GH25 family lysozyme M1 (1,4-beta-N-acetylmuramidase)